MVFRCAQSPTVRLGHASLQATCRDTRLGQLSPRFNRLRRFPLPLLAGAQSPRPQNHARRVPQPCLHGYGRAAGVSVTPWLTIYILGGEILIMIILIIFIIS